MAHKGKVIREETTFGDEVLRGLNDLLGSIRKGKPITVRDVTLELEPAAYEAGDVQRTRRRLGLSQAVFARLLAVNVKTIQSWEQGEAAPSGIARRVLDDINQDPKRWLAKLAQTKARQTSQKRRSA
jgi:putative transcriptional regulator